ncbi:MAG TPA: TrkA family potassium uptake protein [Ktedonobacterales bacterium]|nr:TrkA family potassium uptake protein [Ktedonobacterales bacterium]
MYIIIGGGGQVGYYLTKGLLDQGNEVVLLEKEAKRFKFLQEQLGATNVGRGDACEARVLEDYGCLRADAVIAVTGDDEDNLVICQVAKHKFGVKRTVARVNNPRNEKMFLELGIDRTVSPTQMLLNLIELEIPHHTLVPLIELTRAGLRLVEVTVPPDSQAAGKTLRQLDLPREINVALIHRGDDMISPQGDTMIEAEDKIYALVKEEGAQTLRRRILSEVG